MKKTTLATLIVLSAAGAYTSQDSFQNIQVDGTNISIPQGSYQTAAGVVRIAKDQTVQVTAVTSLRVEDEEMVLPKTPLNPGTWKGNGKLSKLRVANITACGSVDPESITVVRKNRSPLKEGEDYLAEKRWGRIVKGPSGAVADNEPVFVSYTCRLQRLDTVAADKAGKVLYLEGKESMIAPPLPALPDGCIVLFNVYRPYDSSVLLQSNIFLNEVDAKTVATGSTPGRTPKTLAKLKAGEPVTIVCWGDSVTVGADLENPQDRYSNQLEQRLKAKFPRADITVTNISIGGTQSAYWLKGWDEKKTEGCTFARVLAAKPDLVTLEFVNDTSIPIARSR
ncbi:MAG: SGNH/GDSL hydrolase family protein, partial [Kiritimatiellales bacterium]|nr:SGNH/GDSL hydrolase family protein [Kiritimatiellales bacterium]